MPSRQYVNRTSARLAYVAAKKGSRGSIVREVGARFAIAREQAGLSQVALAKLSGVDQGAVSKFETGVRGLSAPKLLAVLRVAAEYGVDVGGFVLRGLSADGTRKPTVMAATPELLSRLERVAEQLEESSRRSPSERPGTRGKTAKP